MLYFSESWACWCLYGDDDFAARQAETEKRHFHVQWNDLNVGESFRTLDEAIQAKRTHETGGLNALQVVVTIFSSLKLCQFLLMIFIAYFY